MRVAAARSADRTATCHALQSAFPQSPFLFRSPPRPDAVHPIRRTILEILKREESATVNDLAESLEMAPVSVRHHLDLLISDGLVATPRVQRNAGAGRPQQIYALTPEADAYFPNRYRELANDALAALKQTLPPDALLTTMRDFAHRTALRISPDLNTLPSAQRLVITISLLNDLGYMAGYETGDGNVVLHTCNCPYGDLAGEHQELCHMDLSLVGELTGLEAERIHHIASGDGRCSYRLCPQNGLTSPDQSLAIGRAPVGLLPA